MTVVNLNEWYFFEGDTIDKKTCNKIRGWAKDKWIPSIVKTIAIKDFGISDLVKKYQSIKNICLIIII